MLRHARLAERVRLTGTALAAAAREWAAGPAARRKKTLVIAGTALALVGAGSASVATATASAPAATHAAAVRVPSGTARTPVAPGHVLTAQLPRPVASQHAPAPASTPAPNPWDQVTATFSGPATPPAAAQLTPVGTSGPQGSMPISGAQYANATTIVQQVKARKMGIRSAVIAVATAMQESQLQNLPYGDADSLGLFQQRPSAGWGTPQQLLDPAYAANAFLTALQQHQQADTSWVSQPLWATAQAVQASGFPTAYAQWESEAAAMVKVIATSLH
jgi:hypothetical protein